MFATLQAIILLGVQPHVFSLNAVPEFSAVYDSRKNAVIIKWQHKEPGIRTYIIQRSSDNAIWSDIALQAANQSTGLKSYYVEDKRSVGGENYYRLKCISAANKTEYSIAIMVIAGSSGYNWVMYPVPVGDVLTLQYKGSEKIKGVINVLIQNSSGKIMTRIRNSSLTRIIQVSVNNLSKGIYDIRVIVEDEIIWNQRFIK